MPSHQRSFELVLIFSGALAAAITYFAFDALCATDVSKLLTPAIMADLSVTKRTAG